LNFSLFEKDMGPRPSKSHQIDRINNDGNYEPSNCKWSSRLEQMAHTRHNHILEFNGEKLHISQWARRLGFTRATLKHRLERGWSIEDALSSPERSSKFTKDQIESIRSDSRGCAELGRLFSVTRQTIWKIKNATIFKGGTE
jgi:hypothetical protein